jgi:DNA transformation protein
MAVQAQFLAYLLEQLQGVSGLRSRRMFGGIGLYGDDVFFGLIDDDTLYFKTNDSNVAAYLERGMPRFMPFPERPEATLGYHQVPADVIEDPETLVDWARRSVAVAMAVRATKPPRKVKKPSTRARVRGAAPPTKAAMKTARKTARR